jgi:hypothetical protein
MKNSLLSIFTAACLFISSAVIAQAPQAFNYQAVARNSSGQVLSNQNVNVRLTIRTGTAGGTNVYQETHQATTNQFGLFTLEVGKGSLPTSTFANLSWGSNKHFLQVELDPAAGSNYQDMGTTELLSVPYALVAGSVANSEWSTNGNNINNANSGKVEVGATSSSFAKFTVIDSTSNGVVLLKKGGKNNNSPSEMLKMETDSIRANNDIISLSVPSTAPDNAQFIEFERGSSSVAQIHTNGDFETNGEYQRRSTGAANLVPIAYGYVNSAGVVSASTGNVSATWNAGNSRYEITITGESYSHNGFVTIVTPFAGGATIPVNDAVGGKLLVKLFNTSGTAVQGLGFHFVMYKP